MAELTQFDLAHQLVQRRIDTLERLKDDDGGLCDSDVQELRRAYVLRDRIQRASVDAVELVLDSLGVVCAV